MNGRIRQTRQSWHRHRSVIPNENHLSALSPPLTLLENVLRMQASQQVYSGGFVEHYPLPVLYPVGLTQSHQVALCAAALFINALVYWLVFRRRSRAS